MNKKRVFREAVDQLIDTARGTQAESAPLDVLCDKAKITFGDLEKKVEHKMCLLAWCGFQCRLDFAQHLIEKGASECCTRPFVQNTSTTLTETWVAILVCIMV